MIPRRVDPRVFCDFFCCAAFSLLCVLLRFFTFAVALAIFCRSVLFLWAYSCLNQINDDANNNNHHHHLHHQLTFLEWPK